MKSFFILLFTIILLPSTAISTGMEPLSSPLKRRADDSVDEIIHNSNLVRHIPLIVSISHHIEQEGFNHCNERILRAVANFSSKGKGYLNFVSDFQAFLIETSDSFDGSYPDQEVAKVDARGYYYGFSDAYDASIRKYECKKSKRHEFYLDGFRRKSVKPLDTHPYQQQLSGGISPSEEIMYQGDPFFNLVIGYPHPLDRNTFDEQIGAPAQVYPHDFPKNANIYFKSPSIHPDLIDLFPYNTPSLLISGGINSQSKLDFSMTPSMLEKTLRQSLFNRKISWVGSGVTDRGLRFIIRNILDLNIDFGNHRSKYVYY